MARQGSIHGSYHEIKVFMTDGTDFVTRSTYHGDTMKPDVGPHNHPAWNDSVALGSAKSGSVDSHNSRYENLSVFDAL